MIKTADPDRCTGPSSSTTSFTTQPSGATNLRRSANRSVCMKLTRLGRVARRIAAPGPPKNCPCGFHRRQLKQAQGRSGTCRFLSVPRSPARAAVKIRCRSRRTLSSGERQSMASHTKTSFAGPFTMRCPTCPPIPADMFSIASQLTYPRQRPFRNPGTMARYPASYPATATWRSSHDRCGFLSAFAHRHSLLGHPVPARRIPPLLTVGLPRRRSGPDFVGVPAFRTCEKRPGWVPSLLRGGGVVPAIVTSMTGACRFSTASPLPR